MLGWNLNKYPNTFIKSKLEILENPEITHKYTYKYALYILHILSVTTDFQ